MKLCHVERSLSQFINAVVQSEDRGASDNGLELDNYTMAHVCIFKLDTTEPKAFSKLGQESAASVSGVVKMAGSKVKFTMHLCVIHRLWPIHSQWAVSC